MQSVNLLENTTARKPRGDGPRQAILAMLLAVTVLVTMGVLERATLRNLRVELARAQAQSERLRSEQAAMVGPNAQWLARIDAQERDVLAVESVARQLRSGNLGSTQGFAEQLRAFGRTTTPGIWLTGLTLDSTTESITIDGKAIDASRVPVLLHALQSDPLFGGTRLASIEIDGGEGDGKDHAIGFHIATPSVGNVNPPLAVGTNRPVAAGTTPPVAMGPVATGNATDLLAGNR
jgi:hypothetical protein